MVDVVLYLQKTIRGILVHKSLLAQRHVAEGWGEATLCQPTSIPLSSSRGREGQKGHFRPSRPSGTPPEESKERSEESLKTAPHGRLKEAFQPEKDKNGPFQAFSEAKRSRKTPTEGRKSLTIEEEGGNSAFPRKSEERSEEWRKTAFQTANPGTSSHKGPKRAFFGP